MLSILLIKDGVSVLIFIFIHFNSTRRKVLKVAIKRAKVDKLNVLLKIVDLKLIVNLMLIVNLKSIVIVKSQL